MAKETGYFLEEEEAVVVQESNPEQIRDQMVETRASLTDKLECLEAKIMGTAEAAQASVENTIEAVKETVQDTVSTVQRTFDLKYQVSQRPWFMMGASVVAGYALGQLGRGPRPDRSSVQTATNGTHGRGKAFAPRENELAPSRLAEPPAPTMKSRLLSEFGEEINMLESAAIGAAMGMIRDWLKKAAPSLATQVDKVMNSATNKMGGEPIHGPVLS